MQPSEMRRDTRDNLVRKSEADIFIGGCARRIRDRDELCFSVRIPDRGLELRDPSIDPLEVHML